MHRNIVFAALILGLALVACSDKTAEGIWSNGESLDISLPDLAANKDLNNREYALKCCGAGFKSCDSPDKGVDITKVDEVVPSDNFTVAVTPNRVSDYACRVEDKDGKMVTTGFEVEGLVIGLATIADYADGVAYRFKTCEPDSEGCNARGVVSLEDATAPTTPATDVVSYSLAISLSTVAVIPTVFDLMLDSKSFWTETLLAGTNKSSKIDFAESENQKQVRVDLKDAYGVSLVTDCTMDYRQKISLSINGQPYDEGLFCDESNDTVSFAANRDGTLTGIGIAMSFTGLEGDLDHDGYVPPADCGEGDATRHPGATEVVNYLDDDCDSQVDEGLTTPQRDDDGDGYCEGTAACYDTTDLPGDCNDGNANTHPGATEVLGDGVDQNCNGNGDDNLVLKTNQAAVQFKLPAGVTLYFWSGLDGTLESIPNCSGCGSVVKVVDGGIYAMNLATPLIYNGKVSGAWCYEPGPRSQCSPSEMKVVATGERWDMVQSSLLETQADGGGHGNGTVSCTLNGSVPTSCTLRSTATNAVISKL